VALTPDDAEAWFGYAAAAATFWDYHAAVAPIRRALQLAPDHRLALRVAVLVFRAAGEARDALAALAHGAELGDDVMMADLADAYARGIGTAADAPAARLWLTRAAARGHVGAMEQLAALYRSGAPGIPADAAAATSWSERAALPPRASRPLVSIDLTLPDDDRDGCTNGTGYHVLAGRGTTRARSGHLARRQMMLGLAGGALAAGFPAVVRAQVASLIVRIGTGGVAGTYFPIGRLIAEAISGPATLAACADPAVCGISGCAAVAQLSNGSVANAEGIESGDLEAAPGAIRRRDLGA
jgi:hypothetical protein